MANLALTYRALGQHNKALAFDENTLKLRRARLGDDHPDTLNSMSNLAVTYGNLGQHDKARALLEQTLKLRRAKLGDDHPSTLTSMNNLAATYSALGQHDKALELQQQTLKLRRAKLGDDHPSTLTSMNNLAATYSALGQYDQARALLEQTLKLRRAKLGDDHPDTLTSMANLAEIYRNLGQNDKALAQVSAIIAGAEKQRTLPGLGIEQRQSFFAAWSDDYLRYARWHALMAQPHKAFDLADLSKARTLTDSIRNQIALRALPASEQQNLQASEAKGRQLATRLEQAVAEDARDSAALVTIQKEIDSHRAAHAGLLAAFSQSSPKFAQMTALKPAGVDQAGVLLKHGEAFVSYVMDRMGAAQAYVLDRSGKVIWSDLGVIRNLAQSVAATRDLLAPETNDGAPRPGQLVALKGGGFRWLVAGEAMPAGATPAPRRNLVIAKARTAAPPGGPVTAPAEALAILQRYWHETLIQPILAAAGPYPRWIVSPDKNLALLPFDNLVEKYDSDGQPSQRLVDSRNVTLVQSFAVYALLKQRDQDYAQLARPKDLLAIGNAVYGEGWSESRGGRRGRIRGYQDRSGRGYALAALPLAEERARMQGFDWQNLPGTAREIDSVSRVFSGTGKVDRYLGPQASEGQLQEINRTGQLKDYRYLLFSAHGYLARNPSLSSLVLSRKGNPPGIDGYVTSEEWPSYDVRSDLTVLSACDTGVGEALPGESVMGLPYALFVAGNKNTLLSLWPVDDDATSEFMTRFFGYLKAGKSQPDALRATKHEFAKHPQWKEPRYWAAFTLYGI